jgi:hypothetical protein
MMMRHEQPDPTEEQPGNCAGEQPGSCAGDPDVTCGGLAAMAWSYLDDELPWCERRRIRAHLARCHHCRAYLHFQRAFLRAVRAESNRTASDALRQRVRAALAAAAFASTRDDEPA